jgi:hypothetical protein
MLYSLDLLVLGKTNKILTIDACVTRRGEAPLPDGRPGSREPSRAGRVSALRLRSLARTGRRFASSDLSIRSPQTFRSDAVGDDFGLKRKRRRLDFLAGRVLEHTANHLVAQFTAQQGIDFNALRQLPALFMNEGQEDEIARVGQVVDVQQPRGRDIVVTCTMDANIPGIPNRVIAEMANDLHIDDWEFRRNHWAVKDVDLFRTLVRLNLRRRVGATGVPYR